MKIVKIIGTPSEDEVSFIEEQKAADYIKSLPKYQRKKFSDLFDYCLPEWQDFLNHTLLFDPRKRLTVDEALEHSLFDEIRKEEDLIFEVDDLELQLPSGMPMDEIKNKMIEEIRLYQKSPSKQEKMKEEI